MMHALHSEHTVEEIQRLIEAGRARRARKCDHRLHARNLAVVTETDAAVWYDYPCGCALGIAKTSLGRFAKLLTHDGAVAAGYLPEPEAPAVVEGSWLD